MAQSTLHPHGLPPGYSSDPMRPRSAPCAPIPSLPTWPEQWTAGQEWHVFPMQIRFPSDPFTSEPSLPSGAQNPPASSAISSTSSEPPPKPTKRDETPGIIIDNLTYQNRVQASQLMNAGHQLQNLSSRLNEANRISGEQYKELNELKTEKENAEQAKSIEGEAEAAHNPNKSILEQMQMLISRLDAMEAEKISGAQAQRTINTSLENTISNLQQELKTEIERNEARTKQRELEHTKRVSLLESTICGLQDDVKDLVDHQITTDPVFIVRIHIRAVLDKMRAFLHEVFTGEPSNERGRNTKHWWAKSINPTPSESASMTKEALDEYRYQRCLAHLVDKKLDSQPMYRSLIRSGSLRFLAQASIELRNQANAHAHEVGSNMTNFRRVLHATKSTHSHLCTAADFTHINGIVDFLEVLETKKEPAI